MKITEIIEDFENSKRLILSENLSFDDLSGQMIDLCKSKLNLLRKHILIADFDNLQREINFYKHEKPILVSELYFYYNMSDFYLRFHKIGKKSKKKLIKKFIIKSEDFICENLKIVKYYEGGSDIMDEVYFTRKSSSELVSKKEIINILVNEDFSCYYSNLISEIKAVTRMHKELSHIQNNLNEFVFNKQDSKINEIEKLEWSGSKTDFIELIYALYFSKSINSGKTPIIKIQRILSEVINIDSEIDIYNTFKEIKNRKQTTKYIDKLKDDFEFETK